MKYLTEEKLKDFRNKFGDLFHYPNMAQWIENEIEEAVQAIQMQAGVGIANGGREEIILEAKKVIEAHGLPIPNNIDDMNFQTINGALNEFIDKSMRSDNRVESVKAYFLAFAYFYKYFSPDSRLSV